MDGNDTTEVLGLLCCFCNEGVRSNQYDPCDLLIATNWDKPKNRQHDQSFWCHLECFRKALHKDIKQHLLVDLLSCQED